MLVGEPRVAVCAVSVSVSGGLHHLTPSSPVSIHGSSSGLLLSDSSFTVRNDGFPSPRDSTNPEKA